MGANRLPYFLYPPQSQQGDLLGSWSVPGTISATIGSKNLLEQFYMARYLSKYFAVRITLWLVFGSALYSTLAENTWIVVGMSWYWYPIRAIYHLPIITILGIFALISLQLINFTLQFM